MQRRYFRHRGLAGAVAVAVVLLMAGPLRAQSYRGATSLISTPRAPDGKPDLTGVWNDNHIRHGVIEAAKKLEDGDYSQRFVSRRCAPTQKGTEGTGCFEETNETADLEFVNRLNWQVGPSNLLYRPPLYKPEYWDKVQDLDYNTNAKDPIWTCLPEGIPRMGPPTQIIQTAKYVVFFYTGYPTNGQFRIIPVDGRGHDPVRAKDISYLGDPVGRWDGDTLVVESVGFNDDTWLGTGGFFHSYDMKVTERFRREGNIIHYQVTVEDPTVLLEPWVMTTRDLDLNTDPTAYVHEGDQCQSEFDRSLAVSRIRH